MDEVYINNLEKCLNLMHPLMDTLTKEEIHILLGDSTGKLIKRICLSKGVVNESFCSVREIVDVVMRNGASQVVLVHNHPSNNPTPSQADIVLTEQIYVALSLIGVTLGDHIIITKDSYYSFYHDNLLDRLANGHIEFRRGMINDIKY